VAPRVVPGVRCGAEVAQVSMEYIRNYYQVPAKRGMRVEVYFRRNGVWTLAVRGRITSASHRLHVNGGGGYHPRYGIVYLGDGGEVLCDTREPHAMIVTPGQSCVTLERVRERAG